MLSRRDVVNSATTYYAFDPQGSAVDVMQGNNGLPAAYSAFGIPASGGASSSPFGFGAQWGYYTDGETGLLLCIHRYYDPYTGRFINRDPESYDGGVNLYSYCRSNPTTYSDPDGYQCITPCELLRAKIYEQAAKLEAEIAKYDPVQDGKGGFSMKYGSGFTKPGGHYREIQDLQRGLLNKLREYQAKCQGRNGNGGTPNLWGLAEEKVPPPVMAPAPPRRYPPNHYLYVPPTPPVPITTPAPAPVPVPEAPIDFPFEFVPVPI